MRFGSRFTAGTPIAEAPRRLVSPSFSEMVSSGLTASSASLVATVTADGSANTMGAWSELVAATPQELNVLALAIRGHSANGVNTAVLLDVGIGAGGAEVVVAPYLNIGSIATNTDSVYMIPVRIPSGSRIALRCQCGTGGRSVTVYASLLDLPFWSPTTLIDVGTTAASSTGTSISYPGSINTKSAWVELTSATTAAARAIIVGIGVNGATSVSASSDVLVDIGAGGAGSEVVIAGNLAVNLGTSESVHRRGAILGAFAADLPSGTRLAARAQWSASSSAIDVSCLLVPIA